MGFDPDVKNQPILRYCNKGKVCWCVSLIIMIHANIILLREAFMLVFDKN